LNEHEWKSKLQQAGFTQIEIIDTPDGFIQTDIHDSNPSENINADLYDIWDEHDRFITQNHDLIGFRAFRCQVV
jgi:hypothetical protein